MGCMPRGSNQPYPAGKRVVVVLVDSLIGRSLWQVRPAGQVAARDDYALSSGPDSDGA